MSYFSSVVMVKILVTHKLSSERNHLKSLNHIRVEEILVTAP